MNIIMSIDKIMKIVMVIKYLGCTERLTASRPMSLRVMLDIVYHLSKNLSSLLFLSV